MKRKVLLVTLLSITVSASSLYAQPEPGDIGLFFDSTGETVRTDASPLTVFDTFVVLVGAEPFSAVEFGIEHSPELAMFELEYSPMVTYASQFVPFSWHIMNFTCWDSHEAVWLVRFTAMLLSPAQDVVACLTPCYGSCTPSFSPPTPGYLVCDEDRLAPLWPAANGLGIYPDGCAVINPTHPEAPITADKTSWGSVKARF